MSVVFLLRTPQPIILFNAIKMMATNLFIMVGIIAMLIYADVVDFGNLEQYEPRLVRRPASRINFHKLY